MEAKKLVQKICHELNLIDEKIDYTCNLISKVRIGAEGQEGMNALLEKRKPKWME